jgi:hypothetical protein
MMLEKESASVQRARVAESTQGCEVPECQS